MLTYLLIVIGALNWGLVGLFGFNLVSYLFGFMPLLEKAVYVVVGAAAVYEVIGHKAICKVCGKK